jgi:hypothetical protein
VPDVTHDRVVAACRPKSGMTADIAGTESGVPAV